MAHLFSAAGVVSTVVLPVSSSTELDSVTDDLTENSESIELDEDSGVHNDGRGTGSTSECII